MQWNTTFEVVNYVTMIVMGIAVCLLPPWILLFYCKNFNKWNDEDFSEKYGAIFEGIRKDKTSVLAYPIIFILRRFALVVIVTAGH